MKQEKMKSLTIIVDYIQPNKLKGLKQAMVLTHGAMLACDKAGVEYFVPDDFYHYKLFQEDFTYFIPQVEILLRKLDKYNLNRGLPEAYMDNVYWFMVYFANLFYLSRLARGIDRQFSEAVIVHSCDLKNKKVEIKLTRNSLNFHDYSFGLSNKIEILQKLTNAVVVRRGRGKGDSGRGSDLLRKARDWFRFNSIDSDSGKANTIWVIQDGYEVELLKEYLPEFHFVNPMREIEQGKFKRIKPIDYETYDWNHEISSVTVIDEIGVQGVVSGFKVFVERYFSDMRAEIKGLFKEYHDNVIKRFSNCKDFCAKLFFRDRPRALFYSVGATRAHETLLAHMANDRGVPVFYFQHGGGGDFGVDPLLGFIKKNKCVDFIGIKRADFGSIGLHRLNEENRGNLPSRGVLYCVGPPAFHAYKDLLLTCSDAESYRKHRDIIDVVSNCGLSLDIKLHPQEQGHNRDYFKKLAKPESVRILSKGRAEEILKDYKLIIIDFLTSALTSAVLMMKVPVICYTNDMEGISNSNTLYDLKTRIIFVSNKNQLALACERYKSQALIGRFITVKRRILPLGVTDPGSVVADYVREKIVA